MKLLALILLPLALGAQVCTTAYFPGAVATSPQLLLAIDNLETSVTTQQNPLDTTLVVANTGWQPGMIATVGVFTPGQSGGYEQEFVTNVSGTTLTVTRAFGGGSPGTWPGKTTVVAAVDACYHNRLAAETGALESGLGANFSNLPTLKMTNFTWAAQTPGGSLSSGSNAINVNCPAGLTSSLAVGDFVYLSGGTGTAEQVPITGGTCLSGSANGTLIVTAAHTHSGAWTVAPASAGLQEAVNVACTSGGGTVNVPGATYTMYGTVTVPCSGIRILGDGPDTSILYRTTDYGDTIVAGSPSSGIYDLEIDDLQLWHDVGFTGGGNPNTCANMTPANPSSAQIHTYDCVGCRFQRNVLRNLPYQFKIDGGALSHYVQNQTYGLWDYANSGCQQGLAGVQINSTSAASAQLLEFDNNYLYGYVSAARSVTYGSETETVSEAIGPQALLQINSCESCKFHGGILQDGGYYGIELSPQAGAGPFFEINVYGIHFDGSRLADVYYSTVNETAGQGQDIFIHDNFFNGELTEINALNMSYNSGYATGGPLNFKFLNNSVRAYAGSGLNLQQGSGVEVRGNTIREVNVWNGFSTGPGASGVYAHNNSGSLGNLSILDNIIGGGPNDEAYGTFNHMLYGIDIPNAIANTLTYCHNTGPYASGAPTGTTYDTLYQCAQFINGAAQNYPQLYPPNTILSETGANNAIVGALPNTPLTTGMVVRIELGHTLQAGANTFNYNGGGALSIVSHLNSFSNIATAYSSVGSFIELLYDGFQWEDMSQ